jgi:hypothetical protein
LASGSIMLRSVRKFRNCKAEDGEVISPTGKYSKVR